MTTRESTAIERPGLRFPIVFDEQLSKLAPVEPPVKPPLPAPRSEPRQRYGFD